MERHIDEQTAQTQLKQILDLASNDQQSFVIDRQGEPPVIVMGIKEYLRLACPAPDWLESAWKGAEERGISNMTMDEIDAEIAAYRREKAESIEQHAR